MTTPRASQWITLPFLLLASAIHAEEPAATTQLAEKPSAQTTTEVFQLKSVAPESVCQTLREIFPAPPSGPTSHYKITVVPETHSLLVTCSPEVIEDVRRLIASLDVETPVVRRITRLSLKHVGVTHVSELLPRLLPDAGRSGGNCRTCSSASSGPLIVYDKNTDAIIVSATDDELVAVRTVVDYIDRPNRNVLQRTDPVRASIVTFRVQGPAEQLVALSTDELLLHAGNIEALRTALRKIGPTTPVIRMEQGVWLEHNKGSKISIGVKTPVLDGRSPAEDDENDDGLTTIREQSAEAMIQGYWLDVSAGLAQVTLNLSLHLQDSTPAAEGTASPASERELAQLSVGPVTLGRPLLLLSMDTDAQGGAVALVTRFSLESIPTEKSP